ncbi:MULTISPECIES: 15,16-dihydrobiliverdin:ferredoxin oxidoreductase [unclassified Roseofilum]|uniref:15,16-dihydrobiliverdin:ferredoxin oxidoreductase n=1 Tax=unclassified Roseofilum TaxID=2620099 RepID=UPI000E8692EA|nr:MULTISPECIES: 15,16-dihydrobiliverdin:ferredoxin oxidoreductase [unclassified Roseofilum]HBR00847.1 15,16-dihydrobiliverdin:ferredoxin oxidoreductase [Cyanobacteria bacterium UBA11691]MBP0009067.1 15,16-dihydrobiliverdin:ferredoxin oxidoreductase [Roseofilum sp. Belize Diploria]MBP0014537.1 15,16-dihydrobiliverdin:ferredoxin oxidoreductase [Roseofilum sp. SID3]MBP0026110.1 15,16-dihydrobiliverdin:ferredoxin oxidoreductase [Roseofilum sp. SID2]MBP0033560.1 15,16-dihydrobiliverdin:ferredoxin 
MYKPFMDFLEQELFERFDLQSQPIPPGLERQVSTRGKHPATIQSWCYQSPELRKIRYTYIDGGEASQVFNSVIYPSYEYDLPLLGIDFLSFGKSKKNLVVMDFQPLFRDPDYLKEYIEPMKEVRDRYSDLAQNLEMKFYDANQYFSQYLLFAKTDTETVKTEVFEAYKDYLNLYWELLGKAKPSTDPTEIERIRSAQRDYDQYSADRDPASGLFSSYFGHEWSEQFLYEFLFSEAKPLAVSAQ